MIAYLLIILGVMMRVLPHVPNMAPVAAVALFSGMYLNKKMVPWIPLAIMAISDLVIGLHDVFMYTWGSFLIIGLMGMWMRDKRSSTLAIGGSVLASVVFFVITNFGVWLTWYPRTLDGFLNCYIMAVPFFGNALIGNAVFMFVLYWTYEFARRPIANTRFSKVLLAN